METDIKYHSIESEDIIYEIVDSYFQFDNTTDHE